MTNQTCSNCRYYGSPGFFMGYCHRHAPVHVPVNFTNPQPEPNREWPRVKDDDWCGDYEYSSAAESVHAMHTGHCVSVKIKSTPITQ